jgi:colanic acid biosynthesis glycosyl transferase WcaI
MFLSWRTGAHFTGVVHDIESGLATSLGMAQKPALLWLMRRVEQLAFNRTDELIVLSAAMKTELRDLGCVRPITTLPIWSQTFPDQPVDPTCAPAICYSGNFGKKQALDLLLPLISMLSKRRPEVRVILRGDGTERERIQQQVEAMKATNTVFLPLAPPEQFAAALQEARVHLVPQANNTANYAIPSKVFSIMAAGRPFVCIAEDGSPLQLLAKQTGAGICVAPNDDEALFSTLEQLVTDVERCRDMGELGRAYVRENLSRPKVLGEYERIILGCAL